METRNSKLLKDFTKYCKQNPNLRFWQALLNWSGFNYIAWTEHPPTDYKYKDFKIGDTYYFEERNK